MNTKSGPTDKRANFELRVRLWVKRRIDGARAGRFKDGDAITQILKRIEAGVRLNAMRRVFGE